MGLLGVIALGVGNTIGSGLFFIPQNLAAESTPLASLIAFAISALGCIIVAFSFANLSQKMPQSGGTIVYVKKAEVRIFQRFSRRFLFSLPPNGFF